MAYKTFSNGDVLNASEINDNLMNQSVMVFSGTSARSAALPSPLEGMLTYREDTHDYEAWDGSAWVPVVSLDAWKTWAPNMTAGGWTQGNGTFDAKYIQIGKTVHFKLEFTSGSTTVETTNCRISLPVTAVASDAPFINAMFVSGSTRNIGICSNNTSSSFGLQAANASTTYLSTTGTSSTVPFTWASGDKIFAAGTYEAV